MPRIMYIEKLFTVPAGESVTDFVFRRAGEKAAYLHYIRIVTNANTASAVLYIDSSVFSPSLGPNASFELGKPNLFDKIPINDSISISIRASSTGNATVLVYAYIEVVTG
jgi:hypothetical protein